MTNWSVILNVLLLVGVIAAMFRLVQTKRQMSAARRGPRTVRPPVNHMMPDDDIIAVRKLEPKAEVVLSVSEVKPELAPDIIAEAVTEHAAPISVHLFLLAKDDNQLAGYELLQTLLAAGLRFGEGQLFHRHQSVTGQGPIICSLATATEDGTFDLQNIGGFSVRGLCLFMEASGSPVIDAERLAIMIDTAKQLSEGLNTHLLDDTRTPWSDESLVRYQALLNTVGKSAVESTVEPEAITA